MEEPSLTELPDDLILKIFSLLPFFKESVATNLLTKRWEDLMFDDNDKSYESLTSSLAGNIQLQTSTFFVKLAVKRSVRRLRIQTSGKTLEYLRDPKVIDTQSSKDQGCSSLLSFPITQESAPLLGQVLSLRVS
ncbi:hypothetical protein YC2023_035326 [Brassica napus]